MVGWSVNNELERILKEPVMSKSRQNPHICLERLRKATTDFSQECLCSLRNTSQRCGFSRRLGTILEEEWGRQIKCVTCIVMERSKHSEKNLPCSRFVHYESHMHFRELNSSSLGGSHVLSQLSHSLFHNTCVLHVTTTTRVGVPEPEDVDCM
jgi:hypothetical protein